MGFQAYNFENEHTVGEIKALLAPLFQTEAEKVGTYIVAYLSDLSVDDTEMRVGLLSSDPHPECRIAILAELIKLISGDLAEGSDAQR